jgi:hypothetical protein
MSKFQRAFLMVVGLVGVGAVPLSHLSAATSVLGPTVCVSNGAPGTFAIYRTDGVELSGPSSGNILCTLFRDNTTNTTGMQDLEVSVNDPTSGGGISCLAVSTKRDGSSFKTAERHTTKTGEQILDFGGSLNSSVSKGHYSITCSVAVGGVIHNIYYLEP